MSCFLVMRKTTFIYTLSCPVTNEIRYVGKANNPTSRFYNHLIESTKTYKNNWIKSLKKKGLKPILEILEEVLIEEWTFWEEHYISLFKSWNFKLTNMTSGGEGRNNLALSEETKLKLSLAHTGKKMSEEAKARMRESRRKVIHPKSFGEAISRGLKGKPKPEGFGEKVRLRNLGKTHSGELNLKRSMLNKKPIQIDNICYFSTKSASEILNVSRCYIQRRLNSVEYPEYKLIQ